MNQTRKRICSVFLAFCMVFAMLPTATFAETDEVDSGPPLEVRGTIINFADLDTDIAAQTVDVSTVKEKLTFPNELEVTVAADFAATETDSQAQNVTSETVVAVSNWTDDPDYDSNTAGVYTFTPMLDLPEGLTVAADAAAPTIAVTVKEAVALQAQGGAVQTMAATGTLTVGTETGMSLATDQSGTGWAWTAEDSTFTITDNITGPIYIYGSPSIIKTAGAWTVTGPIVTDRATTITGGGTLTVTNSAANAIYVEYDGLTIDDITIYAESNIDSIRVGNSGSLTMSSGTLNATGGYSGIRCTGDFNLSGTANVTAVGGAEVQNSAGIQVAGNMEISGTAAVNGSSYGSDGTGIVVEDSIIVTDSGTLTTGDSGKGDIQGDLTVNGATANVAINGDITGDLVVLNGTVAITGTVSGGTIHTGGTLNGSLPSFSSVKNGAELIAMFKMTTPQTILLGEDVTLNEAVAIGASHTLDTNGKTLCISGGDNILDIGLHTLTINGGGTVTINNDCAGIYSSTGTLTLESVTVNLKSSQWGICAKTVNVGDGANVIIDAATGMNLINMSSGYQLNINTGGKIDIQNSGGQAIGNYGGTLHLNGGTLTAGVRWSISIAYEGLLKVSSGILDGKAESSIYLNPGTKVEGLNGKFNDRGTAFASTGLVTVGDADATPSDTGLTAGEYVWDGTYFTKSGGASTETEITGFASIPSVTAGTAGSATYANASEVIAALPTSVTANYSGGTTPWSVTTWVDTDNYNPAAAGSYTFTATLGTAPTGYTNSVGHTATVEVVVNAPSTGTVTGKMYIDGTPYVDLTANQSGTGWVWTTATATLTLNSSYGGSNIHINCDSNDTINLAYTDNVTITGTATIVSALFCNGNLKIDGSGGTLTVNYTGGGSYCAVESMGALELFSGSLVANSNGTTADAIQAVVIYGNRGVSITGDANVTATATGANSYGVCTDDPSGLGLIISTTGSVTANGTGSGYALAASGKPINISNGTVILSNSSTPANLYFGTLNHTGGTINGNPPGGPTSPIEITGFEAIPDEDVGKAGSTICANVAEVINLLKSIHPYANAMHSGDQTMLFLITDWEDTDGYNPNTADSYTFTATVAPAPGFANSAGHKVTVEVVVAPPDTPAITITKHPQNVTVTQGRINGTLTAEAVSNNGKPILYQWYRFIGGIGGDNVEIITGATSNTFTIPTGLTAGTYQYLCIFNTDGTDYVDSNTAIVTVNPPSSSGGGGGGSGGGSATPPPATTPPQAPPNQPITVTAPVTATGGTNGTANVNIPASVISDAIVRAQTAARAQGNSANGISVELNVTMPQGATSLTAAIPQGALQSLVTAGINPLTVNGAPVSLGLDQSALKSIQNQASGGITIGMTPATELSAPARSIIGNRPVYNITISYTDKDGKTQSITNFGSSTVTLAIPYTPGRNEAAGYLFGVYVDGNGNASRIPDSLYDASSGSILIHTNHLSVYGVGYTAPSAKFTDVSGHWARESIDYVVGRGLLSGTSETTFAPNTVMTRGMLVTALGRLAGVDTKAYNKSSFTDVKADSAFLPYIEWAYNKGIVQGIGNNQFAADRTITREEIAVICANYAKATGYKLPATREATNYTDASHIGSAYKDAVTAMQQAGIMMGEQSNKFNPKSNATRAEVSSILHRYIKLAMEPATAQPE